MTTLVLPSRVSAHTFEIRRNGIPTSDRTDTRWLTQWTRALIVLGLVWRLGRYLLQFPIWGDEILFGLNLVDRDASQILQPLANCQVAPPLFLAWEWVAFHFLGPSELSIRLLPQVAAILALLLFKPVAERALKPLPAALAIGILAVSFWPVSMSTLAKPYSLDLLGTVLFLYGVVRYLEDPKSSRWLWALAGIAVPVMWMSYPAIFVAGAVSGCLLPSVWRNRRPLICAAYMGFNVAWFGAFVFNIVVLIGRTSEATTNGMEGHWLDSFPPAGFFPLLKWLSLMNTGQMFAYPMGDRNGGSALTTLFFLIGISVFAHQKRGGLVLVCLVPFALCLVAAALRRYPYGGLACRIHQHVVPLIVLAMAQGLAWSLERVIRDPNRVKKLAVCLFAGLALFSVAGLARDVIKPYREINDIWTRKLVRTLSDEFQPDDMILLNLQTRKGLVFDWYTLSSRDRWVPVRDISDQALAKTTGSVWLLTCAFRDDASWVPLGDDPEAETLNRRLMTLGDWQWRDRVPFLYRRADRCTMLDYCIVHRWTKADKPPKRNLIVGTGR